MEERRELTRPRYVPPTLWSLDSEGVRELLGPAETQYSTSTEVTGCLPVVASNTVQDNWFLPVGGDPVRVRIEAQVELTNDLCPDSGVFCGAAAFDARGPLDPKVALYPPGVPPAVGPFTGYVHPDCGVVASGETFCTTKPADACILCDTDPCSLATHSNPNGCVDADVDLSPAGTWIVSVAPQAPAVVAESEGCYRLRISDPTGRIGPLTLRDDDDTVTFIRR